ncbi:hypothetical protein EOF38_18850 [Salmonella enterica]|nr:hypothetical protein [Salmonella enterica]
MALFVPLFVVGQCVQMPRHELGGACHISGMFQERAQRWQVGFMVGVVGVIARPEDQIWGVVL